MAAQYPNPENEPNQARQLPSESSADSPLSSSLLLQQGSKPWFLAIFDNLKDIANFDKQPPLQVSFRPLSEQDLLNSDDPSLRQLAEVQQRKSFFRSLKDNVASLFAADNQAPLQLTSRPLTEEELKNSSTLVLERATLPWYRTFASNLKELIFPEKLPPLQVTSKPLPTRELFSRDEYRGKSQIMSIFVHVGLVLLAFFLGTNKTIQKAVQNTVSLVAPADLDPYVPKMQVKEKAMGGGGGGGDRSPLPASKGKLPRPDLKQFTPPVAVINNENPRLIMEPTIIAPPDANLPKVNLPNYGDPFAKAGPPSNGPGSGGGIGSGSGGGVGSGEGGGFGPGKGGGFGGGAFRIGGGVSAPVPIFKVEPEYSEEARKAKFQGTVLLAIVVDESGQTGNVRVVRALGMGLDEKAMEAVRKWRFKPGYKDGKPVSVLANVEVNFRLL
ncbi:MAG TPA: energy transducer TonB [Paludibaculum sp.]|jgi:TonB family protein